MYDNAFYRWNNDPEDGEYEIQFDHFETSQGGSRRDQAVLLIVDRETDEIVGDVTLPTAKVPHIDPEGPTKTKIYHATIEVSEVVDLRYDPELSKQRHKKAQERHNRIWGDTNDVQNEDN